MDLTGMINEGGSFNLAEIWQFPLNRAGDSTNTRAFAGTNQLSDSNLATASAGDPARMSHELSQAVIEGISGAWKRRDPDSDSAKVVSTRNWNGGNECEKKRENIDEGESRGIKMDEKKKQLEPVKDYIHVRARRGQATDSHSLAERARREKISERMKILQDIVPGCNKVIGKAVVLDEIINYIQSLQRQVEFLSMKLEAVNSRMNDVFHPKEFGENPGEMQFGSESSSRGATGEWLDMQIGSGGFQTTML